MWSTKKVQGGTVCIAAFEAGSTRTDATGRTSLYWYDRFEGAHRVALDERSWVEHVPGWLSGSEELFYEPTYDGPWINLYRGDRHSTSWHDDGPSCKRDVCIVPVLSLAAAGRFLIRPLGGGRSIRRTPSAGDLIVMGRASPHGLATHGAQADTAKRSAHQREFQQQRTGIRR